MTVFPNMHAKIGKVRKREGEDKTFFGILNHLVSEDHIGPQLI